VGEVDVTSLGASLAGAAEGGTPGQPSGTNRGCQTKSIQSFINKKLFASPHGASLAGAAEGGAPGQPSGTNRGCQTKSIQSFINEKLFASPHGASLAGAAEGGAPGQPSVTKPVFWPTSWSPAPPLTRIVRSGNSLVYWYMYLLCSCSDWKILKAQLWRYVSICLFSF